MKKARVVTIEGARMSVPPRIKRIDSSYGHGWEVCYLGFKFFTDKQHGPLGALNAAIQELHRRYAVEPPHDPSSVRDTPLSHKTTTLPAGISGPVLIRKAHRKPYAEFKVSLPVKGRANRGTSVYIATEDSWNQTRIDAALTKAVKLRAAAVAKFREAR